MDPPYSAEFYAENLQHSTHSARSVLAVLYAHYCPDTVVDFGCGSGAWLAAAEAFGSTVLHGYDGPWVNPAWLASKAIRFLPVDLASSTISLDRQYDLAISVEVAEHLPEAVSDKFIDLLCSASNLVVFSAAVPNQGGRNHINEQPQSYWVKKFLTKGYRAIDIFRPVLWNDASVTWWFRQNLFLMVNESEAFDWAQPRVVESSLVDVIHPENFQRKLEVLMKRLWSLQNELQQASQRINQLELELRRR